MIFVIILSVVGLFFLGGCYSIATTSEEELREDIRNDEEYFFALQLRGKLRGFFGIVGK